MVKPARGSSSNIQMNVSKIINFLTAKICEMDPKYFVPSVLLSNVVSLTPKTDELAYVVKQNQCDTVGITETWLKD